MMTKAADILGDATVMVTGGAGYIGSHVILELVAKHCRVVVLDDLSTGAREAVPNDLELLIGDIGSRDFVRAALEKHRPDAVIHLAASISVPESIRLPLKYYRNNLIASANLVEHCVAERVRAFIFSSTAAVYGAPDREQVPEDAPLAPINPYGETKLATEWLLRAVDAVGSMRHASLRYFNVAGADARMRAGQRAPSSGHLITTACKALLSGDARMQIFGSDYETPDGTCVRDFIHVSDLAAAHVEALSYLLGGGDSTVLNCGYGRGHSVREVLDAMQRLAGRRLNITLGDRRPGDPPALIADVRRLQETLNWRPANAGLDNIAGSALEWARRLSARPG